MESEKSCVGTANRLSTSLGLVQLTPSTDIEVKPDGRIFLRAERSGTSTGRVYTLTYKATDAAGNVSQGTAEVKVPHNKGKYICLQKGLELELLQLQLQQSLNSLISDC